MTIWFRKLSPQSWRPLGKGPWALNRVAARGVHANRRDHLSATFRLNNRAAAYCVLYGPAGAFSGLSEKDGLALAAGTALRVDVDAETDGTARCSVMILEYDHRGERIGTVRAQRGASLVYPGRPDVDRVVVCIRCSGDGLVRLRSASVRIDPDYYNSLVQERFPVAAGAEQTPPLVVPVQVQFPGPTTLLPRGSKAFVFPEVPAGEWRLEISHKDRLIQQTRRALVGRLALSGADTSAELAESLGLPLCARGYPFSYLGGGKDQETVRPGMNFALAEDQRAVVFHLTSPGDHALEVQSVVLKPKHMPSAPREVKAGEAHLRGLARSVREWIGRTPGAEMARFVLYADIDLNTVDGSSIWMSSMASLLCANGPCVVISKANVASGIVLDNVENRHNLVLLEPQSIGLADALAADDACQVLRFLDDALPDVGDIFVRGLSAAASLADTRRFRGRLHVYLTDFYTLYEQGVHIAPAQARAATLAVTHAQTVLTQTMAIADRLKEVTGLSFHAVELPPAIPDDAFPVKPRGPSQGALRIGYAGKINPQWGILELLAWAGALRSEGLAIELDVVANKISGRHAAEGDAFRRQMASSFARLEVRHHSDFNRAKSMALMAKMDFVWCWRPPELEDHTLELSTKLVEMVANGGRCICYPSAINRDALGEDYPFFVRDLDDLRRVLGSDCDVAPALSARIRQRHSLAVIGERLTQRVLARPQPDAPRRICFAASDFKFVDPYVSRLKASGHHVVRDQWNWSAALDPSYSESCVEWADTVFCEWGLANAVWYSRHKRPEQRLFVRAHLQEVQPRARKFGEQLNIDNVEKVIFVSERVRDAAVGMFGWPEEKTIIIPNFVLGDEYAFRERQWDGPIRLGMVGIVPQRKRFDRAVDLLIELSRRGQQTELIIKGPRPETLHFMHGPSRADELLYYQDVEARIAAEPGLANGVRFEPWGNDVAAWYGQVDHILSCSDFESFHYAVADGVLAGCHPLIWPWEEAERIYTGEWIVPDTTAAADRIEAFRALGPAERSARLRSNRALVEARYGCNTVFAALDGVLGVATR